MKTILLILCFVSFSFASVSANKTLDFLKNRALSKKEQKIIDELKAQQKNNVEKIQQNQIIKDKINTINMKDTKSLLMKNSEQGVFQKCLESADTFQKQQKCANEYRKAIDEKKSFH